jgi:hypothetical protein
MQRHGFGLWALEPREGGELLGFTGLAVPAFEAHFTPAVEIGWRLARPAWGYGYAAEAAGAALAFGFEQAGLAEPPLAPVRASAGAPGALPAPPADRFRALGRADVD